MIEKITLPALTQLLALQSGDTKKQSEDFIKEIFSVISSALAEGETVKIKGLGVFKTIQVEARKSVNVSTGEDHKIPAHRKVVFVASKELAAMVNEPFEMFETVEIGDEVTFEEEEVADVLYGEENIPAVDEPVDNLVADEEAPVSAQDDSAEYASVLSVGSVESDDDYTVYTVEDTDGDIPDPTVSVAYDDHPDSETDIVTEECCQQDTGNLEESRITGHEEKVFLTESDPESDPETESSYPSAVEGAGDSKIRSHSAFDDEEQYRSYKSKTRFGIGFITGFLTAVVICFAGYVLFYGFVWPSEMEKRSATYSISDIPAMPSSDDAGENRLSHDQPNHDATVNPTESVGITGDAVKADAAPTAPSDGLVYDTITKTRYLTTMAKEYYGNYNLWPVIYEENKAFLGHPDRIRPGTRVVVPPLSKYGVDPDNPEDIAKAKRKGVEIYSRYK